MYRVKYAREYAEYLKICERYNQKPSKDDFFGYLQGIANNLPAMNRPDYGILYGMAWD